MRVVSVFDGISGLKLALNKLGLKSEYFASEVDKYATAISKYNFPDIKRLGDVRSVGFIPDVTLLAGGSPCTDLSISGLRQGLQTDTLETYLQLKSEGFEFKGQSFLFWEYIRLLKLLKPKYFLLENVASMSKVNRELIDRTLGVKGVMINSSLLTAQSRKRLYWSNLPITQPDDLGLVLSDIVVETVDPKYYVDLTQRNVHWRGNKIVETKPHKLADVDKGRQGERIYSLEGKAVTLKAEAGGLFRGGGYVDKPIKLGYFGKGGTAERIYSDKGKSVTLKGHAGGGGAKTGLYLGCAVRTRNSVPTLEVRKDQKSNCLISPWGTRLVLNNNVRRLTPTECERLQNVPDGFTEFGDFDGVVKPVSDSQRYKGLGNGFSVDIIAHILEALK